MATEKFLPVVLFITLHKMVPTFDTPWMKSYIVTIQMRATGQHSLVVPFAMLLCCIRWLWCSSCRWLEYNTSPTDSVMEKYKFPFQYSRSSPCDQFHKRPALVKTNLVKPHLNCDLNIVMKNSLKRPQPQATTQGLIHINKHCQSVNGLFIKILYSAVLYL